MDLSTFVQIAQIVAPTVVGCGVILGVLQLREFQRNRRVLAAVEVVHSFRTAEFNRALRMVWALPDGLSAEQLRARGQDLEDAAILLGTTVESVGVLVYRRVVPIDIVDELMGDAIVAFWPKLSPWIFELRQEQGRESVYEWFQWLVERLRERQRRNAEGAHVRYRKWRSETKRPPLAGAKGGRSSKISD
jgi:hypothetical protein